MDFIHSLPDETVSIAAIATPPGEGGISIVRISGKTAFALADQMCRTSVSMFPTHTVRLGSVWDAKQNKIDQVLILVFRSPKSFTGEDTVELHCHGGSLASKKVLERALELGARLAKPGEFTMHAFLNGKVDLVQAESIQKLIHAKNEKAYALATRHLEGKLSQTIQTMQAELTKLAAILEAWVDFPEEGLEFISKEELLERLRDLTQNIEALAVTYEEGKRIEEGVRICLAGAPNAGKSSLMNALLRKERAIVTPIAGTTRDFLEESLLLGGVHVHLFDTAGLRETNEIVEKQGVERSKKLMEEADFILYVLDASAQLDKPQMQYIETLPKKQTILVWNKIDLPHTTLGPKGFQSVSISAKNSKGIESLKTKVDHLIWENGGPDTKENVICSLRQKKALEKASFDLRSLIRGLEEEISPEFLGMDVKGALDAIGTIIGTNVKEDVLSSIFSQFCVGK